MSLLSFGLWVTGSWACAFHNDFQWDAGRIPGSDVAFVSFDSDIVYEVRVRQTGGQSIKNFICYPDR